MNLKALNEFLRQDQVVTDVLELACYARDMSIHVGRPELILLPETVEQVQAVMAWASRTGTPVTPRGAGTSVTGATLPFHGGAVLDLCRLNRILAIRREDCLAVVEAGLICRDLNLALEPTHFFAPDPGSSSVCTIGGMIACNASGLRAVKYGTTKDHVLGLKVVMPDGRLVRTGSDAPKNSSGLGLTRLLVCSEGTLGVIVEATLKILPKPQQVAFARALFDSVEKAGRTVAEILARGIPLAVCEIMDRVCIDVVNRASSIGLPAAEAMLVMEVDGHPAAVLDQITQIHEISLKNGALVASASDDPTERGTLWRARQALVPSLSRLEPGKRLIPLCEDFGVPISKIPETIRRTQALAKEFDILVATFGHVGDGNIHATFVGDVRSEEDWEKIRLMGAGLMDLALELGGTLTAEHGVGIARSPFMRREHGEGVEVMRSIKAALDPQGIMNPGKVGLDDSLKDPFDNFAFAAVKGSPPTMRSLGTEIDNEVLVCVQCGFCRAVCPVFSVTGLESSNARGRMILAFDYLAGKLEPSEALAAKFFRCTTCGNCTTACPSRLKVGEVVEACRRDLTRQGFTPPPLATAVEAIGSSGNPYQMPAEDRVEILPRSWRESAERRAPRQSELLLYLGCVPSLVDTKIAPATLKLFEQAGVRWSVLGEDERCCGYLAFLAGDQAAFEEAARENARRLDGAQAPRIATPCAGCYRTLTRLYRAQGIRLATPVVHFSELFLELLDQGSLQLGRELNSRVTFHDPCDLGRHLGQYEAPRAVLRAVPGLELVEMARHRDQARCCGGGGGVGATDPELGVKMAVERIKDAEECGAEIIVSSCAACKKNLAKGAQARRRQGGKGIKVMDLAELLWSAAQK